MREREREENEKRIKTVVDLNYTSANGDREERIFHGFFFSFFRFFLLRSSSSIERFDQSCLRLKVSTRRRTRVEGSQPRLIDIRERRLTSSFSWKKVGELGWQKLFRTRHYRGKGNPCLEKQISLPEERAIFESRKNPFLPLQNSPESVVRGIDL